MDNNLNCALCYSVVDEILELDCPHHLCLICASKTYTPPRKIKCFLCDSQTILTIPASETLAVLALKYRKQKSSKKKIQRKPPQPQSSGKIVNLNSSQQSFNKQSQQQYPISPYSTRQTAATSAISKQIQFTDKKSGQQSPFKTSSHKDHLNNSTNNRYQSPYSQENLKKPTQLNIQTSPQNYNSQLQSTKSKQRSKSPTWLPSGPSTKTHSILANSTPKMSRQFSGFDTFPAQRSPSASPRQISNRQLSPRQQSPLRQLNSHRQINSRQNSPRAQNSRQISPTRQGQRNGNLLNMSREQMIQQHQDILLQDNEFAVKKLREELELMEQDFQRQEVMLNECEHVFKQQVNQGKISLCKQFADLKEIIEMKEQQLLNTYEDQFFEQMSYFSRISKKNQDKLRLFREFEENQLKRYYQSGIQIDDFLLGEFQNEKQQFFDVISQIEQVNHIKEQQMPSLEIQNDNFLIKNMQFIIQSIKDLNHNNSIQQQYSQQQSQQQYQQLQQSFNSQLNSSRAKSNSLHNNLKSTPQFADTARFQQQNNKRNFDQIFPNTVRNAQSSFKSQKSQSIQNQRSLSPQFRQSLSNFIKDGLGQIKDLKNKENQFNNSASRNLHFNQVQDVKNKEHQRNSSHNNSFQTNLKSSIIKGGTDQWTPMAVLSPQNKSPISSSLQLKSFIQESSRKHHSVVQDLFNDQEFRKQRQKQRENISQNLSRSPNMHEKQFGFSSNGQSQFKNVVSGLKSKRSDRHNQSLKDKLGQVKSYLHSKTQV